MMRNPEKIFRCPIHGSIKVFPHELRIINHPLFQRLRHLTQLGFVYLIFPGATHNRFLHSLGVLHLGDELFENLFIRNNKFQSIFPESPQTIDRLGKLRKVFRLAALMHDIGHMPFSHVLENRIPHLFDMSGIKAKIGVTEDLPHHELISLGCIDKIRQDIPEAYNAEECRAIISLISGENLIPEYFKLKGICFFKILHSFISGEIDCDRMDYLLRDSHFCGVPYGKYDTNHLIRSVQWHVTSNNELAPVLMSYGLMTFESFLLARSQMISQIYLHKTVLGFDHYLRQAMEENELKNIPTQLDFEQLSSFVEPIFFTEIEKNSDKKWCSKIYHRIPPKKFLRLVNPTSEELEELEELKQELEKNKIEFFILHNNNSLLNSENAPLVVRDNDLLDDPTSEYELASPITMFLEHFRKKLEIAHLSIIPESYQDRQSIIKKIHKKWYPRFPHAI